MIITMSGKKQSGKSTSCYFLFNLYQALRQENGIESEWFFIHKNGDIECKNSDYNGKNVETDKYRLDNFFKTAGCKIYSFADYLKKNVCVDILNLTPICLYGDNRLKSIPTHIMWDSMPIEIQKEFRRQDLKGERNQAMTHRQVMEVIGSGIFRAMYPDCWARATYSLIEAEKDFYPLALISDARFPNEISMGAELGAISIRLKRDPFPDEPKPLPERALDDFPEGEYTYIIQENVNEEEKEEALEKILKQNIGEVFK